MRPHKYFIPEPESVHTYPDGRQVCQETAAGKREYKARITQMGLVLNIVDPFMGSGTSLVAAKDLGILATGI